MALQCHLFTLIPLMSILLASEPAISEKSQVPIFAFSWLNDSNTFQAGDVAVIKIKVLGNFDSKGNASLDKSAFRPTLTVNGKIGNSSFVSGVLLDTSGDTNNWRIVFTPIRVGVFNVIISDDPFKVLDSSLHYKVVPGRIYPSVCIASWMDLVNEFDAGAKAALVVVPRDAFGNNISSTGEALSPYNLTVSALYANGSIASVPNITYMGWNEFGYIIIEFIASKSGNFLLQVRGGNQILNGTPLPFKVNPGPLDVSNCIAKWRFEIKAWQIFSKMEIFIHQQDQYGNLVSGLYEFDADVVEQETNLSIPVADLHFEEVMLGVQLFSFSLLEPGNFLLTISDLKHNRSISNMPFAYTVFIGYCDGSASIVNGSGLNESVAGETVQFSIYLNDIFQYPSFVEVESIRVQIVREIDSYPVQPIIHPIINGSVSVPACDLGAGAISPIGHAPAPSARRNTTVGHLEILADAFSVTYTPEKSGIYEIYVLCGQVLLNGGHSIRKEVRPGQVNVSLSKVARFAQKVPKLVENEIVLQLTDSFSNPVPSQQSRLKLEIASVNKSGFSSGTFVDNNDGSYTGHYQAKDVGTYEMCVSFDDARISPCPFGVNVYGAEYFPKAFDDKISVWEDESIAFDVLANDDFAGNNATIVEFSKPDHASLLQYDHIFRYTPYADYYGNDSFAYTISDVNGNLAWAAVSISVLNIPPQFVSLPNDLQATEDAVSPRFGGFSGFEIKYSNLTERIYVALSAKSGTLFLSPMAMQFWQPMWGELSVKRGENGTNLILDGFVEVINMALQSVQYLGNENFSGEDSIQVSAGNMNGENILEVPVLVEPINDPPFINAPKFIVLNSNGEEEVLIFDRARDKFEFSVGDPDILSFPGKDSRFIVTFSVEVDDGFLITSLPAELINTTELKLMNSFRWQPLQTYVTISKHFMVKANGVRFRGTIDDCNNVMQQLSYHSGEQGAILTVKINDMGHYGCYSDCVEKISMPLYAEATVNLIRRKPMSSFAAHAFGSVIVIESLMVFFIGVLLLFFTCKCAILLVNERSRNGIQNSELSSAQNLQTKTSSTDSSEHKTYFTGCCSSPFLFGSRILNNRQSSSSDRHRFGIQDSGNDIASPFSVPLTIEKQYDQTL